MTFRSAWTCWRWPISCTRPTTRASPIRHSARSMRWPWWRCNVSTHPRPLNRSASPILKAIKPQTALPTAPTDVIISEVTATSVRLEWSYKGPEDLQFYVIQYKPKHANQVSPYPDARNGTVCIFIHQYAAHRKLYDTTATAVCAGVCMRVCVRVIPEYIAYLCKYRSILHYAFGFWALRVCTLWPSYIVYSYHVPYLMGGRPFGQPWR